VKFLGRLRIGGHDYSISVSTLRKLVGRRDHEKGTERGYTKLTEEAI
jgi:hypothetical protein